MNNFRLEKRKIKPEEYQTLRQTTGWAPIEDEVVIKALEKDLFSVCILEAEKVVGMGRVIGDGAIYFYIQDIIVHPEYRGKGIGDRIMNMIENYLAKATHNNSFVGLMAAEGVHEFYSKYGYAPRAESKPGMFKVIRKGIL